MKVPRWLVYCLIADLLWGVWGIVPKEKSAAMSDGVMQIISMLGLIPVALLFLLSPNLRSGTRHKKGIVYAVATGLCGGAANFCILRALGTGGDASAVLPLTGVFPLVTLILAVLFLRERPNKIQITGVLVAIVAVALFSGATSIEADVFTSVTGSWMGFSLIAVSLLGIAGVTQKIATTYISAELSTVCFALAFIPVSIAVSFLDSEISWEIPIRDWFIGIIWGAVIGLAMIVQFAAYITGKASVVTALAALYPAVTVLLAVAWYQEEFTVQKAIAIGLALAAAIALSYESPAVAAKHVEQTDE